MTRFAKQMVTTAAATCLLIGTGAFAQNQPGGNTGGQNSGQTGGQTGGQYTGAQAGGHEGYQQMRQELMKADNPDKLFLIGAAVSNQKEIQWAQIAQQKSQNPQVKQVADSLLRDHQQLAQQLQKVIDQQGLTTPQQLPALAQQEIQVLQSLSGEQFDQCFLSDVKASHMATISKFEDEAKIAKDQSVKQFASQNLPTLQQHTQMVQQAAVAVGLPSGTEAQPAGSRIPGGSGSNTGGNTDTGTTGQPR